MLILPRRESNIDKELLKRITCDIIDRYYGSDNVLYHNGHEINDINPVNLTKLEDLLTPIMELKNIPYHSRSIHNFDIDRGELEYLVKNANMSFSRTLVYIIDNYFLKDSDVYHKAYIDRTTFNKIINGKRRPSKSTALALAAALQMNSSQAAAFIGKANHSLNSNDAFDIIVSYCLDHGIFEIPKINEYLNSFNQPLLGSFKE